MIDQNDPTLAKLAPALLGSLVSLRFMHGKWHEKVLMFVGGSALSFYASGPAALWMRAPEWTGFVGFALGLLGMTLTAKIYEVLLLLDASQIAKDVWESIKRKWGA